MLQPKELHVVNDLVIDDGKDDCFDSVLPIVRSKAGTRRARITTTNASQLPCLSDTSHSWYGGIPKGWALPGMYIKGARAIPIFGTTKTCFYFNKRTGLRQSCLTFVLGTPRLAQHNSLEFRTSRGPLTLCQLKNPFKGQRQLSCWEEQKQIVFSPDEESFVLPSS